MALVAATANSSRLSDAAPVDPAPRRFLRSNLVFSLALLLCPIVLASCAWNDRHPLDDVCMDGGCVYPGELVSSSNITHIEFVQQLEEKSCGAAVLASVLSYWDIQTSYDYITENFPPASLEGYSIGELKSITKGFGLEAFSFSMTGDILKQQLSRGRPVIVAIKQYIIGFTRYFPAILFSEDVFMFSHFVVIFGYNDDGFWIMDPAKGYGFWTNEEFLNSWKLKKTVGLLIGPISEAKPPANKGVSPIAANKHVGQQDVSLYMFYWNEIKKSEDPALFDAYLVVFPNSAMAPLARERLAELRKQWNNGVWNMDNGIMGSGTDY